MLLVLISTLPLLAVSDLPGEAQGTLAVVFPPGTDKEEAVAAVRENSETASQSVQKVASASGIVSQNTRELDDNLCKLLDGLRSNRT